MVETGECRMTLEGGGGSAFTGLLLPVGILNLVRWEWEQKRVAQLGDAKITRNDVSQVSGWH